MKTERFLALAALLSVTVNFWLLLKLHFVAGGPEAELARWIEQRVPGARTVYGMTLDDCSSAWEFLLRLRRLDPAQLPVVLLLGSSQEQAQELSRRFHPTLQVIALPKPELRHELPTPWVAVIAGERVTLLELIGPTPQEVEASWIRLKRSLEAPG